MKHELAARSYSMSEGHAADKAALQGFANTMDAASSPARPAPTQQPPKVSLTLLRRFVQVTCVLQHFSLSCNLLLSFKQ